MDLIQKAKNLGCIIKNDEYYLWEIQKWLRDVHKLVILIDLGPLSQRYSYEVYNYDEVYDIDYVHDTYEEALEEGLIEALKLI